MSLQRGEQLPLWIRWSKSPCRAGMSQRSDWLSDVGLVESGSKDPGNITQLVSDVRQFADVLQSLKEACESKGEVRMFLGFALMMMVMIYDGIGSNEEQSWGMRGGSALFC